MTRFFTIALVSLAVLAGATSAQAGSKGKNYSTEKFDADKYWQWQSLHG
ncbi:MAG: hypothetical protein ACRBBN_21925 [Methyloligellaceae bacterium]